MVGRNSRILLDLNSPQFQGVLFDLETAELRQVMSSLRRLRALDWESLSRHPGLQWELVEHVRTPNGTKAFSLRFGVKIRVIAYRDGDFLCFVSLHPDHDSAYRRR